MSTTPLEGRCLREQVEESDLEPEDEGAGEPARRAADDGAGTLVLGDVIATDLLKDSEFEDGQDEAGAGGFEADPVSCLNWTHACCCGLPWCGLEVHVPTSDLEAPVFRVSVVAAAVMVEHIHVLLSTAVHQCHQ